MNDVGYPSDAATKELERRLEECTRALSAANDALRKSEARFRAVFEIETVGALSFDMDGRVLDANAAFLRMSGYSRKDLKAGALNWQRLTPPDWVDATERAMAELRATGRTSPYEKEYIRKDGSRWWGLFAAKMLPENIGFKFIVDISARKEAETALRVGAARLRQALDIGRMGVWEWDVSSNKVTWSDGMYAALGYAPGEVAPSYDLYIAHVHADDRAAIEAALRHSLRTRQAYAVSYRFVRRNGEVGWCEARGIFEFDDDREPARLIGVTADVTERHRAQAALEELQAELIRVSRLSAVGMMGSTLAHELNQPLTAVASYVETARDMLANPDPGTLAIVRHAMGKAASAAIHAGQIVHRLRDFVTQGDTEKRIEPLLELIDEATALALIGISEMGIQITREIDRRTAFVLADRVQIQQVLVNLIRNAIEAMAGCPRREMTLRAHIDADGFAEVSIADTGTGVAPEIVEQLFQPFVSTKRQGMGLGLSICRTIIEAHGGRMWAEPNPGGGTVFAFTLPLVNNSRYDR